MQPELVILIGNIGTGKSTVSKEYANNGYIIVCKDSMRTMLGAGSYVFDVKLEPLIHQATTDMITRLMKQQKNIVVDETNMDKKTRATYIDLAYRYNYKRVACVMPVLSKEDSIVNRMKDSLRGTPIYIWEEVWEKFNKRYQEPTHGEGFTEIIKRVRK